MPLGSLVEQLRFLHDLGLSAPVVLGLLDPVASAGGAERLVRRLPSVGLEPSLHDAGRADAMVQLCARSCATTRCRWFNFKPNVYANIEQRFARVGEITRALGTRKSCSLRRQGGLGPKGERRIDLGPGHMLAAHAGGISVIDLCTDRESILLAGRRLRKDDCKLLSRLRACSGSSDASGLVVSVASPLNLLKELFTVKGAGTLLKAGTPIDRHTNLRNLSTSLRLRELLEASFSKRLDPGILTGRRSRLYVDAGYRGVAILHISSVAPFFTKFAVEPVARGEGIGQDLWGKRCFAIIPRFSGARARTTQSPVGT